MEDKREVFTALRGSVLIIYFFSICIMTIQSISIILFIYHWHVSSYPIHSIAYFYYHILYIVFVLTISNAVIAIMCLGITVFRCASSTHCPSFGFSGLVLIQAESHNTWLRDVRVRLHVG